MAELPATTPMTEFFVATPAETMYVQRWAAAEPAAGPERALVMIHGGAHSGVVWTTTPWGGPGWAHRFRALGWTVYIVDWPGIGRSGPGADPLGVSADRITDALIALLERIGPAVLLGHSIGGMLSFKTAERRSDLVRALVALAPAPIANAGTYLSTVKPVGHDRLVHVPPEEAKRRYGNTALFPHAAMAEYLLTLHPYSPPIRNAAVGANKGFWIESRDWVAKVPVLFLAAELDQTTVTEASAAFLGVPEVRLGRDWGMPGHGHLFPIEEGNEAIAARIGDWLKQYAG